MRGTPCTGGGGREGAGSGGGRLGGGGFIDYLFFLFSLFISYVKHRKVEEGGREGHTVAGTLSGSVVAGKRFCNCCHDLVECRNDETKKKLHLAEHERADVVPARALPSASTSSRRGNCLTEYLAWTTRRPDSDASCWWYQYKIQTREYLFKNYPQWKSQQRLSGRPS